MGRSNFQANRELSDDYAKRWSRTRVRVEDGRVTPAMRTSRLTRLGDEWGTAADVRRIVAEYIEPFVTKASVVAEIGVGGGRIAARVAPRVKRLVGFDISAEMLKRARAALAPFPHVRYVLLKRPVFPRRFAGTFDFVYAFDVFVHLDLHLMWRYFRAIHALLKPGGKAFIHTTNLRAPAGWRRFASETAYRDGGHYFVSPEIVQILAGRSRLRIVKASAVDPASFYLNRDYLAVLRKPARGWRAAPVARTRTARQLHDGAR